MNLERCPFCGRTLEHDEKQHQFCLSCTKRLPGNSVASVQNRPAEAKRFKPSNRQSGKQSSTTVITRIGGLILSIVCGVVWYQLMLNDRYLTIWGSIALVGVFGGIGLLFTGRWPKWLGGG